jgi:hypothetical protein
MVLAWLFTPKKKLVLAIIDKTVLTPDGQEHVSLTWILNHQKFTKNRTQLYSVAGDYFGFFPKPDKKYRIKGLERFSPDQLEKLSTDADALYITDTYGVYRNEWTAQKNEGERSSVIYGGLSQQDLDLMTQMKAKHKLILTEFNTIGSPTSADIREQFEKLFALHWTGWTGRYFESLDTATNKELPKWLINDYVKTGKTWNFKTPGVAFVNINDDVVILALNDQLTQAIPHLLTEDNPYGLPHDLPYSFWFDVVGTDTTINKVVSRFTLDLTKKGIDELLSHHLPLSFPAVQIHTDTDYTFAYFSGDFADNPISFGSSYFKGIEYFSFLFYSRFDPVDRTRFFWRFYRPLVTGMLEDYRDGLREK